MMPDVEDLAKDMFGHEKHELSWPEPHMLDLGAQAMA